MATVSVRDAGNTSIQATSNTFQIVPVGTMTLTGITLSGTTLIAGAISGTPIGNIAVQATGGSFNGTLAVNDTTRFRIVGNTLQAATTLAAGNYQINIIATQPGANGSPMTRAFTITAAASSNTSVNFSAPTGKTVNKSLWGFTTSFWESSGGGATPIFGNATFRNTANVNLKPAALWINPDWDLDTKFAAGNMTDINTILGNYRSFSQAGVRVIMGVAFQPSAGSASTLASRAANFANYLRNNGFSDIMDFSVGNLWSTEQFAQGNSQSTVISYFNAIADALHGVNASYRCWGPAQWNPGFLANSTWASQVGTRCNGVSWMSYDVLPSGATSGVQIGDPMIDSKDVAYGTKGINNPDGVNQRNALSGTVLANVPLASFDLNMSEYAAEGAQYIGGIYMACYIVGVFKSTPGGIECFTMQSIGGSNWPGSAIGNQQFGGNMTRVSAAGYILGKAGQSVFGPEYTVTSSIQNLSILAVKPTATTFAVMLINYDTANARTVNLSVSAGGVPSGTISRWEIGKSSPGTPTPTPVTGTQPSLSAIAIASETVVILTGTLA